MTVPNQAFFQKVYITETEQAHPVLHHGFEIILNPAIQNLALRAQAGDQKAAEELDKA